MDDAALRGLAEWRQGFESLSPVEDKIAKYSKILRDLRAERAGLRSDLFARCPIQMEELAYRFWSKVAIVDDEDSCWEFTGGLRNVPGEAYGLFRLDGNGRESGRVIGAHRMAYILANDGEVPDHTRHTCDNPPCCRPKHLLNGTHADNMADKKARGRGRTKSDQRGETNDSSVLTDAIVLDARRRCRAGETHQAIADLHGVDRPTLSYAITGKTWGHLDATEAPVAPRRGGTRLTEDDVRAIRASAGSAQELARAHEITPAAVYAIRSRRSWKHVE